MVDKALCGNDLCLKKFHCWRWCDQASEEYQDYALFMPDKFTGECEGYMEMTDAERG